MEGVSIELYFPKPARCTSCIDSRHVSSGPIRCYYRRSERCSKHKVLHLRRQLHNQRRINRALLAASDRIRDLEVELKYANKEIAALRHAIQEKQPVTELTLQPLVEKNTGAAVDGIEHDDFMRAVAASLQTIEKELNLTQTEDNSSKLGTIEKSVLDNNGPLSELETTSAEGTLEDLNESLEDLMKEKKQELQEWMVDFCQTRGHMINNLDNLECISDKLIQYFAGLEGIIERISQAKEDQFRATLDDLHAAKLAEVRAEVQEEFKAKEEGDFLRGAELRSCLDKDVEEKITKNLDTWKETYGLVYEVGALMIDRKLEKAIQSGSWNVDLIDRANKAVHGGSLLADASRFLPSLPDDKISRNIEGFKNLYGVEPEFALRYGKSEKLATLLNSRAVVKQYNGFELSNRKSQFFLRVNPLVRKITRASTFQGLSVAKIAQVLSEEKNADTLVFAEKEAEAFMQSLKGERTKQWDTISKSNAPPSRRRTQSGGIDYGSPRLSPTPESSSSRNGSGSSRRHESQRGGTPGSSSKSKLSATHNSTSEMDEPGESRSPELDLDADSQHLDEKEHDDEAEQDVQGTSRPRRTNSGRAACGGKVAGID